MRLASTLLVLASCSAFAEQELSISYFFPLRLISADQWYELRIKTGSGERQERWSFESNGRLTVTENGAARSLELPKGPRGAELSSWVRKGGVPQGFGGVWQLLSASYELGDVSARRSQWEDGFQSEGRYSFVFTSEPCVIAGFTGRKASMTGFGGPAKLDACLSPEVQLPLALTLTGPKASISYTLTAQRSPPPPTGNLVWNCTEDCGPPPRRPPSLGAPAPAFQVARWVQGKPVLPSKGKLTLFHSCGPSNPICIKSTAALDALVAKLGNTTPPIAVATLTHEAARASVKELGAKHPIGLLTSKQHDALDDAYDLDAYPAVWIITPDGKLSWYGIRLTDGSWMSGNRVAPERLAAAHASVLEEEVQNALAAARPPCPDAKLGSCVAEAKELVCLKLDTWTCPRIISGKNDRWAYDAFKRGCDKKVPDACRARAWMERGGRGAKVDPAVWQGTFEKLCSSGDALACHDLAEVEGRDPDGGVVRAAALYRRACEQKLDEACVTFADLSETRDGGLPLTDVLEPACERGHGFSCTYLGQRHLVGRNAPVDAARAKTLFERACTRGEKLGCACAKDPSSCAEADTAASVGNPGLACALDFAAAGMAPDAGVANVRELQRLWTELRDGGTDPRFVALELPRPVQEPLRIAPGDLLVYALPWDSAGKNYAMLVARSPVDPISLRLAVTGFTADGRRFENERFAVDVQVPYYPARPLRPGLHWLRPTSAVICPK